MRTINLLPPEAAQRATARRKTAGFVVLGIVYVALLALAALWWQGKATDAQDDLDAQLADNSRIEAEISSLSDVRSLRTTYESSVERLDQALAKDIAWGRLLNDLARIIPDRLWITSLTGGLEEDLENHRGDLTNEDPSGELVNAKKGETSDVTQNPRQQ